MAGAHPPQHPAGALHVPWPRVLLGATLLVAVAATSFLAGQMQAGRYMQHSLSSSQPVKLDATGASARAAVGGSSVNASSAGAPATGHYSGNFSTEHPACAFFRSGDGDKRQDFYWGKYDQCDETAPHDWLKRSRSNCYSCLDRSPVCGTPYVVQYHQYLEGLHKKLWEGNLLSLRSFLMTQDLRHAHMTLWVRNMSAVVDNRTAPFFEAHRRYLTVREYNFSYLVEGTPFEGDRFFGAEATVRAKMPHPGSYSDIVRILTLNKYGGFWMDNDVVLYRDLSHLLATSYQFVMRWMNLHIMRMAQGSPLMHRVLTVAKTMPLDHPDFKNTVMEKLCKPNNYMQVFADAYGNTDIYNTCLFRLIRRYNNTGPPEAVLYDMPLGWWDHDWKGCFNSRHNLSDARWRYVSGHYLAQHNRYPRDERLGVEPHPEMTPLARVVRTVKAFVEACPNRLDCLPVDGMSIMAYDGFDTGPPTRRRRRRRSLLGRWWFGGGQQQLLQEPQQEEQEQQEQQEQQAPPLVGLLPPPEQWPALGLTEEWSSAAGS